MARTLVVVIRHRVGVLSIVSTNEDAPPRKRTGKKRGGSKGPHASRGARSVAR